MPDHPFVPKPEDYAEFDGGNADEYAPQASWVPTRKWLVARVTAVAALATMWITTGTWDTEESVAAVGLVTEALISYLTPNKPPVEDDAFAA